MIDIYVFNLISEKKKIYRLIKQSTTHKEFALVQVLAAPVGVFDFFAEDQGHLEEEEVSVATLPDQSFGIPDLKGLLKDQLSLGVDVSVKP